VTPNKTRHDASRDMFLSAFALRYRTANVSLHRLTRRPAGLPASLSPAFAEAG
jgi:hypothetical protein